MTDKPTVFIVDDEKTFCEGLSQLLEITGMKVEGYSSAENFLDKYTINRPGCLILDIDMPGMDGLELQEKLASENIKIPIIFITGYGDVPKSVQALKAGAFDFLEKPFRNQVLIELINEAIIVDLDRRKSEKEKAEIIKLYDSLTKRRQEIMALVIAGNSNREIGEKLNISHRTVEIHRKNIMDKMKASSLPELVSKAAICGIEVEYNKGLLNPGG